VSYAGKLITAGVIVKAVLMGTLVGLLAASDFLDSLALVLVSATATGVFGILIVLIQVKAERGLHERMDKIESNIETKADAIQTTIDRKGNRIMEQADTIAAQTETIAARVTPPEGGG